MLNPDSKVEAPGQGSCSSLAGNILVFLGCTSIMYIGRIGMQKGCYPKNGLIIHRTHRTMKWNISLSVCFFCFARYCFEGFGRGLLGFRA